MSSKKALGWQDRERQEQPARFMSTPLFFFPLGPSNSGCLVTDWFSLVCSACYLNNKKKVILFIYITNVATAPSNPSQSLYPSPAPFCL